jgi:hypothetical protein
MICVQEAVILQNSYTISRVCQKSTHNSQEKHNNPDSSIWQEVATVNLIRSAFLSRKVHWCQFNVIDQQVQSTHQMKS